MIERRTRARERSKSFKDASTCASFIRAVALRGRIPTRVGARRRARESSRPVIAREMATRFREGTIKRACYDALLDAGARGLTVRRRDSARERSTRAERWLSRFMWNADRRPWRNEATVWRLTRSSRARR